VAELAPEPDWDEVLFPEPEAADEDQAPAPYCASLNEFVETILLPLYRRSLEGHERAWCPEWFKHAEAVLRLDALWRAWEHLRPEPALGMSVWMRDHLDHHMPVLLDSDGPFKRCSSDRGHRPLEPLPSAPPPLDFPSKGGVVRTAAPSADTDKTRRG
jgi:hypothetical protein